MSNNFRRENQRKVQRKSAQSNYHFATFIYLHSFWKQNFIFIFFRCIYHTFANIFLYINMITCVVDDFHHFLVRLCHNCTFTKY
jgi:hypothetical protein